MTESGENQQSPIAMHQKRGKVYLDVLRIIAIYFVVYNHTPGCYILPYRGCMDKNYWGALFILQVVKMAVPIFLMISGALLINREESFSVLLKKRVSRILIALFLITCIQYAWFCYKQHDAVDIKHFFELFYLGCNEFAFAANWFLYAYLGILLLLPILRITVNNMSNKMFFYLLGLQVVSCCMLPAVNLLFGNYMGFSYLNEWLPFHSQSEYLPFSAGYCVFYVMMGYFMEFRLSLNVWKKYRYMFGVLAVACLLGGVACMDVARRCQDVELVHHTNIFLTAFLPIPCLVAYMGMKLFCLETQLPPVLCKIISTLGSATFTVMLIENLFRVEWNWMWRPLEQNMGLFFATVIYAAIICSASLLVGVIVKRLPLLKRIV